MGSVACVKMVLDNGFKEHVVLALAEACLDEALDAWADPQNDGCTIHFEIESWEGEPFGWHYNPAQHPQWVPGPVQQ